MQSTITTLVRSPSKVLAAMSSAGVVLHDDRRGEIVGVVLPPRVRSSIIEADCIPVAQLQANCARISQTCRNNGLLHVMQHGRRVADICGIAHEDVAFPLAASVPPTSTDPTRVG